MPYDPDQSLDRMRAQVPSQASLVRDLVAVPLRRALVWLTTAQSYSEAGVPFQLHSARAVIRGGRSRVNRLTFQTGPLGKDMGRYGNLGRLSTHAGRRSSQPLLVPLTLPWGGDAMLSTAVQDMARGHGIQPT